jgi:hypothetical protein
VIPSLSLMIGAYIGFRMIEVLLMPDSHYASHGGAVAAKILAVLVFIVSGLACLNILLSGASFPTAH